MTHERTMTQDIQCDEISARSEISDLTKILASFTQPM
jgi:hypothetical protein